jgi:hypothetical protein
MPPDTILAVLSVVALVDVTTDEIIADLRGDR